MISADFTRQVFISIEALPKTKGFSSVFFIENASSMLLAVYQYCDTSQFCSISSQN
jgi:hypothetical protein